MSERLAPSSLDALHEARARALEAFDARLRALAGGLRDRLLMVHEACRLTGFLPERTPISLVPVEVRNGPLWVVLNPRRARPRADRPLPPRTDRPLCPLCDFPWNQLVHALELEGVVWQAAPSPAPYLPMPQWTVATLGHLPQEPADGDEARHLFTAMGRLLERVPGLLLGWNGEGAGASIPGHRHLHALLVDAVGLFPALRRPDPGTVGFAGSAPEVGEGLAEALRRWRARRPTTATANVVMWCEEGRLYARFVARDRRHERLAGLPEVAAGFMEALLRTVILKTPETIEAFERGRIPADELAAALDALRADPATHAP